MTTGERMGVPKATGTPLARLLLDEIIDGVGAAHDPGNAVDQLGLAQLTGSSPCADLLLGIIAASPHLTLLMRANPRRLLRALGQPLADCLDEAEHTLHVAMAAADAMAPAMVALRRYKAQTSLAIALADLGGAPWQEVTRALTRIADMAVAKSVAWLFRFAAARGQWRGGAAQSSGYSVIAMGKHGAGELNYSSDIDLVVFYEPEPAARAVDGDPQSFLVRLTRDLVKLVAERTADGYVFRIDLRLRPDPGATQVAMSVPAALSYYESFGQNWERAALIKARPIAGDLAAGRRLIDDLQPFIWRRNLDFAAIADIHAMKRQIHAFRGHGAVAVAGHNIKLGRGGIREIEFFTQTQQLIAGGRQPDLRVSATVDALARLRARGWIEPAVERELSTAYGYLRRLEHRLQMLCDEQTQTLPKAEDELDRLARFSGYTDRAALGRELTDQLRTVERHYARLFEAVPELTRGETNMVFAGAIDDPDTVEALARLGYPDPSAVLATVRGWHHGRYPAVSTPRARELLTELQPRLIEALSETVDPSQALIGFDRFLANLPSGVQVFSLLKSTPRLMTVFALLMGSSPRLAGYLSQRRRVIDALLDPRIIEAEPTADELDSMIAADLDSATDAEGRLDAARGIGNEQRFLIGVRLLTGILSPEEAGRAFSLLAERLIVAIAARVERDFAATHGRVPKSAMAVVAMGKLGGREMTAASDLDLIVIYDTTSDDPVADGPRALVAPVYYTRLTQRLVAALTVPTAQGPLYEVDLRLRPSGQKGPLATKLDSFTSYQTTDAWTWEHMALTRARVLSGPDRLRSRIEAAIHATLVKPRDRAALARDVREMRERIASAKGTDDIWDLKQVRGGLVDIEFIAQFLQLAHASQNAPILDQSTAVSLRKLMDSGCLAPDAGTTLMSAAKLYADLTQALRVTIDGSVTPAASPAGVKQVLTRLAEAPTFEAVEADLRARQADVRMLFDELVT